MLSDFLFIVFLRLMAIQQCELVLVHIYPQGEDTLVSDRPKKEVGDMTHLAFSLKNTTPHLKALLLFLPLLPSQISPLLTSEVHSVRAGRHLATKLNILVQQHFDLASTTITNIPMKVRDLLPVSLCLAHASSKFKLT